MSVEAGPGPTTMVASPTVPSTARKLRIKRRVVNLVNPADPQDFSENSIDGAASPSSSVRPRDVTPPSSTAIPEIIHTYTPTGINEHGVKGILRPSGTPGSGNGGMDLGRNFRYRADTGLVRFFPKNRFRVITPNHSLHSPQPPTSPRSSSFLSHLLAVTMPSMSPRKPLPVERPDESWEVPGQEGEVSLVASSLASLDQSGEEQDQSIEQAREESWNGTPEKHSSPLALPSNTDVSASGECELPSTDWQVPEDMSNLLSQRFSQTDIDSFSISEPPPPKPPLMTSIEYADEIEELDDTMGSIRSSEGLNDSNPTVRRLLSPAGVDKIELEPGTPTPGNRPFTSIFADMSAEQADLSWPLTRPTAGERDHTTFHSVVLNDILDLPQHTVTPKAGDITQFFDCTTTSLSPPVPSLSSSSTSLVSRNSPISLDLLQPSKALFEAHSVHTSALASELALYRALAEKLHHEVEERDGVLADLNLRVLAGEVWRVRVEELEAELNADKLIPASSPSPVFHTQRRRRSAEREGDRTTVMDTETRELEIRLAKALADLEMLGRHLTQVRADAEYQAGQITEARRSLAMAEQRERDSQVRDEGLRAQIAQDAELRIDLDQARHLELELRIQLDEAGRRTTDLEVQVEESREIKQADEEVKSRLGVSLEKLKQGTTREEEWRFQVGELEREVQIERSRRTDAERRVEEEKEEIVRLESQNRELLKSLHSTGAGLAAATTARERDGAEVQRLRSDSASKDLEILNLQRRKAELKEDQEMLNIALDSKQQELELIKRKFAVRGVAGSTPLGDSRRSNLDGEINTPAPRKALDSHAKKRSSVSYITPVEGGRTLRGGHGVALSQSTAKTGRVMRRVEEEENRPPGGSVRRERMLA